MYRQEPSVEVDIDEVEYLRSLRFSWTKIAGILEISRSTLYRRLESEGIHQDLSFSSITDAELDEKIIAHNTSSKIGHHHN